jgi:hypothetical protein
MSMDLTESASLEKQVPLDVKRGKQRRIPAHIRGFSGNPLEVLEKMRFFRRLGDAKQQAVTEEWKDMSDKDKNAFTQNIKDLGALKLKLPRQSRPCSEPFLESQIHLVQANR